VAFVQAAGGLDQAKQALAMLESIRAAPMGSPGRVQFWVIPERKPRDKSGILSPSVVLKVTEKSALVARRRKRSCVSRMSP